jgi:hypothetical protein
MDLRIVLEQHDPPVGRILSEGAERAFSGWLGLMSEMAVLLRDVDRAEGDGAAGSAPDAPP